MIIEEQKTAKEEAHEEDKLPTIVEADLEEE